MWRKKHFFLGLAILYLGLFLSKNWQTYFLAFFVCGFFFYLQFKNLTHTVFLISVAAIPYSVGPGRSQAISEASGLTSSYGVIPFTISTVFLSLYLFFKKQFFSFKKVDLTLLIFCLYAVLGFIVQNTYFTSLYGLAQLTVMIIYYFVARVILTEHKILHYLFWILITLAFFESLLSLIQFVGARPVGIFAEEYVRTDPFGVISEENLTLFRASGTLSHPNNLGALLVMLLPLILFSQESIVFKKRPLIFISLILLIFGAVLVTFSRVSIFLAATVLAFTFFKNFKKIMSFYKSYLVYTLILLSTIFIVLLPYLSFRLSTLPQVLDPGNTLDARIKAIQEAMAQVINSPIFGVGINRYIEIAVENPTTDLFELVPPTKLIDIHNLIIQIMTGLGIPALIIFGIFVIILLFQFRDKMERKENSIALLVGIGILLFLIEGTMTPLFVRPLMRLFFLYSAILVSI